MLPSKDRLRSREVEEVLHKGQRRSTPLFSFTFLVPADRNAFAVAVSKKILPNAVDRNKARRRFYSVFSKLKISGSHAHIVFMPKKDSIKTTFSLLQKEIENSLIRAKIL